MTILSNELYFAKLDPKAVIPSKREEDACYDIYPCFEDVTWTIPPHTTEMIPTGIACAVSKKYCIIVQERGSTGSKGIKKSAGVIDSGYRGEIFIAVTNTNDRDVIITDIKEEDMTLIYGEKPIVYPKSKAIAQLQIVEVPKMDVKVVSYEELCSIESERGTGKLGSSKK